MSASIVSGWNDFYVIIGSSAAALTGLTFVVIALAKDARRLTARGLRAFVTPTIVHFSTVLGLAAYLTMPRQTVVSLSVGVGLVGLVGLIYSGITGLTIGSVRPRYIPVLEDWLWHVGAPAIVYGAILALAFVARNRTEYALFGVGAVLTALLFIGIHNAWDVAASISLQNAQDSAKDGAAAE